LHSTKTFTLDKKKETRGESCLLSRVQLIFIVGESVLKMEKYIISDKSFAKATQSGPVARKYPPERSTMSQSRWQREEKKHHFD
jgi:hypothetical protein